MGRQEIQSESHESSESSYFPPSSCHPHPWPASVQRRSILLLQQQWQLCQQEHSGTKTGTPTARASAETTQGGRGATPPAGATTAETCRHRRGIQTTPGPTRLAATRDDEECE